MTRNSQTKDLESTLKSLDTEEFIDIHFYRPLGYRWALLFERMGISPNAVTVAGIFIGIAAGICFYYPSPTINVIGMLLLVWANMYDSADGQLARMTGQKSPLGRILDGFCGDVWFFVIYVAICLRLMPVWGGWIWLMAIVTGVFHGKQAAMADYYRNIHLLFLKGKAGSELSHSPAVKANFEKMTWRHDFIYKLFDMFYLRYTRTGTMDAALSGDDGHRPERLSRRSAGMVSQSFPHEKSAVDEIYEYAFVQYTCYCVIRKPFDRSAVALFRFRTDGAQCHARLHGDEA